MSRKITQEEFLKRFQNRFPDSKIKIVEYNGIKSPCVLQCVKCGKIFKRATAEAFTKVWPCCDGKNESKVNLIKRICEQDGHYQFIKRIGDKQVIIKHLDCGNELTRSIQSAFDRPCYCENCQSNRKKLRISLEEAQKELNEGFGDEISLLYFDGVDSKKSQFRCNKCGLIFNQALYNFLTKTRGCPKCDQRRSKGERAMRKFLDSRQINQ